MVSGHKFRFGPKDYIRINIYMIRVYLYFIECDEDLL